MWRGIFSSRLIHEGQFFRPSALPVLIPQLVLCGFHPRPFCVERPHFVIALWPEEALYHTKSSYGVILPMRDRIIPCLCPQRPMVASFLRSHAMVEDAYAALSLRKNADLPRADELLPRLDLTIEDKRGDDGAER